MYVVFPSSFTNVAIGKESVWKYQGRKTQSRLTKGGVAHLLEQLLG